MKPKTKNTIIIIVAVVVIAAIVCLVFFRRPEWQKIIDNLNVDKKVKEGLKAEVNSILKDPDFDKSTLEKQAANYGMTYDQWLVAFAAMGLGYDATVTNGVLTLTNPYD